MFSALTRRQWLALAVVVVASAAAGVMHYTHVAGTTTFPVATIALAGMAWVVSFATHALSTHFGPGLTGVIQSTLGNLPELFVVVFALRDGQVVVAQTSIIGSLFANALLVLGVVIIAGAWRSPGKVMRFKPRLPNDTSTLLIMAVFLITVLGVAVGTGDKAAQHAKTISAMGAVLLLIVYFTWLYSYLKADVAESAAEEPDAGDEELAAVMPLSGALTMLAVAGAGAAFVSDWFVASLQPAIHSLHLSQAFAGLVVVAIAGNAVENVAGITLAWKGKTDEAISVVKNSVSQIAVFLFPVLVLISLLFAAHLTFVLAPVYIAAMLITALAMWQVTGDGEATVFEGAALVSLYVMLGILTFYE